MSDRAGVSVVEMLVALLMASLVARAGWSALAAQRRAAEAVTLGTEVHEVGRTVRRVLAMELRSGVRGSDWRVHPPDSLTLRAFRGTGFVCGGSPVSGRRWLVAHRGLRAPNPAKDSAMVLLADGRWRSAAVVGTERAGSPCPAVPATPAYRITLDRELPEPVLLRVFEKGSYHLTGRAFRYRVGLGGRQPLTPERVGPESRLEDRSLGALLVLDYPRVADFGRPRLETWTLRSLGR